MHPTASLNVLFGNANADVVTRDWLTGFDVECLATLYIDKPMRAHTLMQAIARVNRVFKDKQGGLVVDYIGIANELKAALKTYTDAKGKGDPAHNARVVLDTFNGQLGPVRDIVVLNAAAGLTVAGISSSMEEGVLLAQASIDNGAALRVVEALKISSNAVAR